jgi:4-carboxymuconolactone decarboxylase
MVGVLIRSLEGERSDQSQSEKVVTESRYDEGMAIRRSVLGNAHVDRAEANKTAFDADFQRYITENVWPSLWGRPGLDRPTRSMLTLAILASLGHWEEFAMHIRATRNTGCTLEMIKEALFHVAIYAGIPSANRAFLIAKETLAEIEQGKPEGNRP